MLKDNITKGIFSEQRVNTGRQPELDLAKCTAIVFMIFLHCLSVASGFNNNISPNMQWWAGQLLGGPFSAPVFMFSMGVGVVYSKRQAPSYLITRGIKLMMIGIAVNIGEFFLPHYLSGLLLDKWDIFPIAGGLLLFCIDILAFAGMSLIVIGILKALRLSTIQIVILALILSIAGSLLRFTDLGSNVLNLIAGYFIGSVGGFTAFPLFNWFIFPAMGMYFGEQYIRCINKRILLQFWPAALAISLTYFILSKFIQDGFLSEIHRYYFMTTLDALFCLICIYGVLGLCYLVSTHLPGKVNAFISKTAGNINTIYVIQWYLIPLTFIFICYAHGDMIFESLSVILIAMAEIAAAVILAAWYKKVRLTKHER